MATTVDMSATEPPPVPHRSHRPAPPLQNARKTQIKPRRITSCCDNDSKAVDGERPME